MLRDFGKVLRGVIAEKTADTVCSCCDETIHVLLVVIRSQVRRFLASAKSESSEKILSWPHSSKHGGRRAWWYPPVYACNKQVRVNDQVPCEILLGMHEVVCCTW